ncbi:MAG: SDR family NAD(P)-dependent oxidoreductase [Acidobacteria bacterium]|nr:SDR family NAD(P)-dependent oxidoreductase [Acidobacteriota bacterium]
MPNEPPLPPVLVTGASGFIGGAISRRLAERGHAVVALDLPGKPVSHLSRTGIQLVTGDVTSRADCDRVVTTRGVGSVVHCAALMGGSLPRDEAMRINAGGTETLASAAADAGVRRFVYISSVTVHGMPPRENIDEKEPMTSIGLPYADSKIAAEKSLQKLQAEGRIDLTVLRPADVYGPRAGEWVVKLVDAMRRGTMIHIGGGSGLVNVTFVDNLADAVLACLHGAGTGGAAYIITDGRPVSWKRYLDALAKAASVKPPRISVPLLVARPAVAAMEAVLPRLGRKPPLGRLGLNLLTSRTTYSIQKARRELSWSPTVGFDAGMKKVAEWLSREGAASGGSRPPDA